jgi:hypothetical protein
MANKPCRHNHVGAEPIKVGPYKIYATGMNYIWRGLVDLTQFNVLVPLDHNFQPEPGATTPEVFIGFIPDFQPPAPDFAELVLRRRVIPALEAGKKLIVFCTASHGRTGTFIAGLIALLEPETDDPIMAARERHCEKSVETLDQAHWVRDLHARALAQKVDEVAAEADPC